MKVALRSLKAQDRMPLERMLDGILSFDPEDRALAVELITIALEQADQKDYSFILATNEEDQPVGYTCYGPTPLTDGTFDLYWIAVDPQCAGQGIGTLLLKAVEEGVRSRNGRMLLIETSSSQAYERTCRFYLKKGYTLAETIPDFYRQGEDRLTFIKCLPPDGSI
jgi:ribosomal protein S18 acetylase RimI-like enzyme